MYDLMPVKYSCYRVPNDRDRPVQPRHAYPVGQNTYVAGRKHPNLIYIS